MKFQLKYDSYIHLPETTPQTLKDRIRIELAFRNPAIGYIMHRNWKIPEGTPDVLKGYKMHHGNLLVPRGYSGRLQQLVKESYPDLELEFQHDTTWYKSKPYTNKIKLFSHQTDPVLKMYESSDGILEAPCGSGKSIMGLELICRWGQPTLVLAHTNQIMDQWKEYITTFTHQIPGSIQGDVFDIRNITIASVMTLAQRKMTREFLRYFGVVILDEAHRAPAYSFRSVLGKFHAAKRIGLTATPRREDGLQGLLQAVVGPIRAIVTEEELINTGFRMRPKVFMVPSNTYVHPQAARYDEALYRAVENDPDRARIVANIAYENRNRSVLILSRRIKHLEHIYRYLLEIDPDVLAVVLTGQVKKDLRTEIVNDLRFGDLNIVLATQLADEGLDIPRLDTIVLTFPSGSNMKLEQQIGRIMRTHPDKEEARIYDIYDRKIPRLMKQMLRRQAFYTSRKYPINHLG